ncbi:unnamed protein product [Rhizophagus irregularis]|nr:unnamed protein product [Rhizophagus irregularis]
MREIINEINLMIIASNPNIIRFFGITKLKDELSLVLEYADGGTLEKYLRENAITLIKWETQLKFANETAAAISWLHHNKIIHGDLHPKNILIHQHTIKLADFGCSRLQGLDYYSEGFTKPRECWKHEPAERPNIQQVTSELNSIDPIIPIDSEYNNVSENINSIDESNATKESENEDSDLPDSPSCEDCDINIKFK